MNTVFKHSRFIVSIVAIVLFISGVHHLSEASIVEGDTYGKKQSNHMNQSTKNNGNVHDANFEKFYMKLLNNWQGKNSSYNKYNAHGKKPINNKTENTEQKQPSKNEAQVEQNNPPVQQQETPTKPVEEPSQNETHTEQNSPPVQQQETPAKPVEKPSQNEAVSNQLNQFEQEVFRLTNEARANNGLPPLAIDLELSRVAREKSRDMAINYYFDHTSPVYGSPFDMMRAYGINYRSAGENIAKGQRTPAEVVNAWMNSPGHRANILNGQFTHIGVGYVAEGNHWTQQFIGK